MYVALNVSINSSILDKIKELPEKLLDLAINGKILMESEKQISVAETICKNPEIEIPDVPTQVNLVFKSEISKQLFRSGENRESKNIILKYKKTCEKNAKEVNSLIRKAKDKMKEHFKPLKFFEEEIKKRKENLEKTVEYLLAPFDNQKRGINSIDSTKYSDEDKKNFEKDKKMIEEEMQKLTDKSKDYVEKYSKMTNIYINNINKCIKIFLELAEPVKSLSKKIKDCFVLFEEKIENLQNLDNIQDVLKIIQKKVDEFQVSEEIKENIEKIDFSSNEKKDINELLVEMNNKCSELKKISENIENKIVEIRRKYGEKPIKIKKLSLEVQ